MLPWQVAAICSHLLERPAKIARALSRLMSPWKPIGSAGNASKDRCVTLRTTPGEKWNSGNSSIVRLVRSLIQKTEPCDDTRKNSREAWSQAFIYTFQCKSLGTAVSARQGAHGIGTFQLLLNQTNQRLRTSSSPSPSPSPSSHHHIMIIITLKFTTHSEQYVDWGNNIDFIFMRGQNLPPPLNNMLIGVIRSTISP